MLNAGCRSTFIGRQFYLYSFHIISSSAARAVSLMASSCPVSAAKGENCAARSAMGICGCVFDLWCGMFMISSYLRSLLLFSLMQHIHPFRFVPSGFMPSDLLIALSHSRALFQIASAKECIFPISFLDIENCLLNILLFLQLCLFLFLLLL